MAWPRTWCPCISQSCDCRAILGSFPCVRKVASKPLPWLFASSFNQPSSSFLRLKSWSWSFSSGWPNSGHVCVPAPTTVTRVMGCAGSVLGTSVVSCQARPAQGTGASAGAGSLGARKATTKRVDSPVWFLQIALHVLSVRVQSAV